MHSFLSLDELHSWGSCQSWLWQLPPAPPLPVLMGTEQEQGVGGEGFQTHQASRLNAFLLNQAPLIKQSSSLAVLSPLASKYFPTLLGMHSFLSLDELHSWGSCQSWLWQLPPAPPLPNESAAFQAGLHTHQKTPNPRGELH